MRLRGGMEQGYERRPLRYRVNTSAMMSKKGAAMAAPFLVSVFLEDAGLGDDAGDRAADQRRHDEEPELAERRAA